MSGQIIARLKSIVRQVLPMSLILFLYNSYFRLVARMHNFEILTDDTFFRIIKNKKEIRIARSQAIYLRDTIDNFDFYFEGVEPHRVGDQGRCESASPGPLRAQRIHIRRPAPPKTRGTC